MCAKIADVTPPLESWIDDYASSPITQADLESVGRCSINEYFAGDFSDKSQVVEDRLITHVLGRDPHPPQSGRYWKQSIS